MRRGEQPGRTFSTRRARGATSNSRRSLALVEGEVTLVNTPFSLTMIWNTSGTCERAGERAGGRAALRTRQQWGEFSSGASRGQHVLCARRTRVLREHHSPGGRRQGLERLPPARRRSPCRRCTAGCTSRRCSS